MLQLPRWVGTCLASGIGIGLLCLGCSSGSEGNSNGNSTQPGSTVPPWLSGGAGNGTSPVPGGGAAPLGTDGKPITGGSGSIGGTTKIPGGGGGGTDPVPSVMPPNNVMTTCKSAGSAVSGLHIQAECAVSATTGDCEGNAAGSEGAIETENGGKTLSYVDGGDAIYYSDVALDGITTLTVLYSKGVDDGNFEVRLDSKTGTLIGTLTLANTGGWTTWKEASATLKATTGKHKVYLVGAGTTAGVANLDWLDFSVGAPSGTSTQSQGTPSAVRLNHIGFDTMGGKHAVVEGPETLKTFSIVDSAGTVVWCGDLKAQSFSAWGSTKSFYSVDFTQLTKPGTYKLQIGSFASPSFEIGDKALLTKTMGAVLGYFKSSRADDADVVAADKSAPFFGSSKTADVHGGWYDAAGDISKYLTHLSYANYLNPQQIPLVAWALAWESAQSPLPATQATAAKTEAIWGADYLMRVLDPAGFFYTNVFDGWSGEIGSRTICKFSGEKGTMSANYQSAMREGGGMSIAALARASTLGINGDYASADYLAGAEKAFAHLNTQGVQYSDDKKENVIDDYTGLLAAAELYAAGQKPEHLEAARARATSLIGRLGASGYFIADGASRPFWHASDAGLPVVALARYAEVETDPTSQAAALTAIRTHLKYLVDVTAEVVNPYGYARQHVAAAQSGFFIPHNNESDYWWQGENARLASLAAAALIGAKAIGASGDEYLNLLRYAGYQLDWISGNNPYDICFVAGFGKNNPPAYQGLKPQNGNWDGGIANGITGKDADGSGIQWLSGNAEEPWQDWRWVEQWLPHSTWYMVAITALAEQ